MRTINIVNQYENNNEYFGIFIKNNSIKYIIRGKNDILPTCLVVQKIGETDRKLAVRNYLRKIASQKNDILKIQSNDC